MKIASTTTIIAPNETSLPNLLSSDAGALLPTLAEPIALPEDPSQPQSLSPFDAMLAVFVLPPNLPLPPLQTPTPTVANNAVPLPGIAQSQDLGSTLVELGTAQESRFPFGTAIAATTPLIPSAMMTVGKTEVSETATTPADQVIDTPAVPEKAAATPTSFLDVAAGVFAKPIETVAVDLAKPFEPPQQVATIAPEPSPTVELSGSEERLLHSTTDSNTESQRPTITEPSLIPEKSPIVSAFAPSFEIPAMPRRNIESLLVTAEEKPQRKLPVTADRQPTTEFAIPIRHETGHSSHGSNPIDSRLLVEQLSIALRTHGDDLAAGQPIELRLRLDPPELGMVQVHLRLSDDAVSVRFVTGDEAVTRILESQLPDLRQSLTERGLAFAQCDVMCDGRQQPSSSFERDDERPSFSPIRLNPRPWRSLSFATRTDRIDVLA